MANVFELKQQIDVVFNELNNIEQLLNVNNKKQQLIECEKKLTECWDDIELTTKLLKTKTNLSNIIKEFEDVKNNIQNINDILCLPEEELDDEMIVECEKLINDIRQHTQNLRIKSVFKDKTDRCNAFLEINSGAGGTESCDWAEMLMRMYLMWSENKGFKTEVVDKLNGEEAGIKSVVIHISGDFVYGLLKNETGTHRLVRISPFNANGKRQTSFAGVFCYPEVNDEINIDINPADLRIDVYRASGAGGQHVNKTESAVRITHIPTGIVASSQTQRSQFQNKDNAMKMLKSKLYELELKKQNAKKQEIEDNKSDISWGNQIRNYVLHPYKMVKDLRSGFEVGNADGVLDGNLDAIIESVLFLPQDK